MLQAVWKEPRLIALTSRGALCYTRGPFQACEQGRAVVAGAMDNAILQERFYSAFAIIGEGKVADYIQH